jgi:hypothetical protein
MALGQITLELDGLSIVCDRFESYRPMQAIEDQRLAFSTSTRGAGIIRGRGHERKQFLNFTILTTDEQLVTDFRGLDTRQQNKAIAKTFDGIIVTNEIDRFVEDAASPTRKKITTTEITEAIGQISYYAKFKMGMVMSIGEPDGLGRLITVTFTELGKYLISDP